MRRGKDVGGSQDGAGECHDFTSEDNPKLSGSELSKVSLIFWSTPFAYVVEWQKMRFVRRQLIITVSGLGYTENVRGTGRFGGIFGISAFDVRCGRSDGYL